MANWSDRGMCTTAEYIGYGLIAACLSVAVVLLLVTAAYVVTQHATGGDTRLLHAQPVWQTVEGERQCVSTAGSVVRQWPDEVCK